jgi:hypothetical protein
LDDQEAIACCPPHHPALLAGDGWDYAKWLHPFSLWLGTDVCVKALASPGIIAEGSGIREIALLRQRYGVGYWRQKKGIATVRLLDGTTARAELHWYEAHGIGKGKLKTKEWL